MQYLPININLTQARILIVGAGEVGMRKTLSVLQAKPKDLLLLDLISLTKEKLECIKQQTENNNFIFEQRNVADSDILGRNLVFACTNNKEINHFIADLCNQNNILCNIIDSPELSSFIVPAHFSHNGLQLSISTSGQSPALARVIRQELEGFITDRFDKTLKLLGKLRPLLLELNFNTKENTRIFRELIASELMNQLNQNQVGEAQKTLSKLLPSQLHNRIGDLLHDCT
ncbi:precorrin-2 dehydrogenase / sirohydrochlorin ferrochelatase [Desulfovibrio litoralis DSM 11393]|uniref:precorrin-2 dehydrogenase n=2 Tax=Desulfovibrio litoralis TaxID=466107 RepID=A0A1M7SD76_9BACT|nr:precorrin-2 dehydrogenase / sirohydrochlorin ferrochelatase [Desulfovibrio litoralis DSM 11393]